LIDLLSFQTEAYWAFYSRCRFVAFFEVELPSGAAFVLAIAS